MWKVIINFLKNNKVKNEEKIKIKSTKISKNKKGEKQNHGYHIRFKVKA